MPSFSETTVRYVPGTKTIDVNYSREGLKYTIGILSIFILILIASNVYLHMQVYELGKNRNACSCVSKSEENGNQISDMFEVQKRNLERTENERRRRKIRRNARRSNLRRIENTIVHLKGAIIRPVVRLNAIRPNAANSATQIRSHGTNGCQVRCFRWSIPRREQSSSFEYIIDHSQNQSMVVGVKITKPGTYNIYAQVAVNGPEQGFEPAVGFETILVKDQTSDPTILLRSYTTQDERGRRYRNSRNGSPGQRPHDTMFHMSTFVLECNDIIIVRPKQDQNSHIPNYVLDPLQSYFGLTLVNPTDSSLQGNYSC